MKLRNCLGLIAIILCSLTAFATEGVVDSGGQQIAFASWDNSTKTLTIRGDAAKKLYQSLNAEEMIDLTYNDSPVALRDHERRLKENEFAKCQALKKRVLIGVDSTGYLLQSASCIIEAPEGTVFDM